MTLTANHVHCPALTADEHAPIVSASFVEALAQGSDVFALLKSYPDLIEFHREWFLRTTKAQRDELARQLVCPRRVSSDPPVPPGNLTFILAGIVSAAAVLTVITNVAAGTVGTVPIAGALALLLIAGILGWRGRADRDAFLSQRTAWLNSVGRTTKQNERARALWQHLYYCPSHNHVFLHGVTGATEYFPVALSHIARLIWTYLSAHQEEL